MAKDDIETTTVVQKSTDKVDLAFRAKFFCTLLETDLLKLVTTFYNVVRQCIIDISDKEPVLPIVGYTGNLQVSEKTVRKITTLFTPEMDLMRNLLGYAPHGTTDLLEALNMCVINSL